MFGEFVNARKFHNMVKGLTASRLIPWPPKLDMIQAITYST
jgi:hypothetical protein